MSEYIAIEETIAPMEYSTPSHGSNEKATWVCTNCATHNPENAGFCACCGRLQTTITLEKYYGSPENVTDQQISQSTTTQTQGWMDLNELKKKIRVVWSYFPWIHVYTPQRTAAHIRVEMMHWSEGRNLLKFFTLNNHPEEKCELLFPLAPSDQSSFQITISHPYFVFSTPLLTSESLRQIVAKAPKLPVTINIFAPKRRIFDIYCNFEKLTSLQFYFVAVLVTEKSELIVTQQAWYQPDGKVTIALPKFNNSTDQFVIQARSLQQEILGNSQVICASQLKEKAIFRNYDEAMFLDLAGKVAPSPFLSICRFAKFHCLTLKYKLSCMVTEVHPPSHIEVVPFCEEAEHSKEPLYLAMMNTREEANAPFRHGTPVRLKCIHTSGYYLVLSNTPNHWIFWSNVVGCTEPISLYPNGSQTKPRTTFLPPITLPSITYSSDQTLNTPNLITKAQNDLNLILPTTSDPNSQYDNNSNLNENASDFNNNNNNNDSNFLCKDYFNSSPSSQNKAGPKNSNLDPLTVSKWTLEQVFRWTQSLNLSQEYPSIIFSHQITGSVLLSLILPKMWKELGVNVGDAIKLAKAVRETSEEEKLN